MSIDFLPTQTRVRLSPVQLSLLASAVFLCLYNSVFWGEFNALVPVTGLRTLGMHVSAFIVTLLLVNFLLLLITGPIAYRWVYGALFIASAVASHYMSRYHIVIDRGMIENALQTDPGEVRELLSGRLALDVLLYGLLPLALLSRVQLRRTPRVKLWLCKFKWSLVSWAVVLGLLYIAYPSYASLLRENRQLTHQIVPSNFMLAGLSLWQHSLSGPTTLERISQDAKLGPSWAARDGKTVLLIVLGETARADRFSLNGYARETNPKLARRDLVNFTDVRACGTSTAVSLPCLFSHRDRDQHSSSLAAGTENLLDVFAHLGFAVQWRDNNSGCKGVCKRVPTLDFSATHPCDAAHCHDEIMLQDLLATLQNETRDQVIVMHQQGSHGPAYYLRYPEAFERFTPVCRTTQLQDCSSAEIGNAYDNSILYTDHFLDRTLAQLEQLPADVNVLMLYVSDHGESLGENNLYLHGTPYFMAPEAQTHVPMFLWASPAFRRTAELDTDCLKQRASQRLSHDYFFHSLIGAMDVQAPFYRPELDLFRACRPSTTEGVTG